MKSLSIGMNAPKVEVPTHHEAARGFNPTAAIKAFRQSVMSGACPLPYSEVPSAQRTAMEQKLREHAATTSVSRS